MSKPQGKDVPIFNKVFVVYGKDAGLTVSDFREHFHVFGTITNIHISKQPDGRDKGYTYIGYNTTSEACTAMEEMDGKTICGLKRSLRVHLAHDKRDNLEIDVDQDHMLERLCIKHQKHETEEEMKNHFCQFGNIVRLHALIDKKSKENLGVAFVKYEQQSQAAKALEECDPSYKPRWADVRKKSDDGMGGGGSYGGGMSGGRAGGYGGGHGGEGYGMTEGYGMGMDTGFNNGSSGGFGMGNSMSGAMGGGFAEFDSGPKRIEAMVPPGLTKQQTFRIFDIAQGLENFSINPNNGLVTVEYQSSKCAAHAKEKIDGLDIYGNTIAVRFSKNKTGLEETAHQLQQTLASLQSGGAGNRPNLDNLVQSIQQVSQALQTQGMGSNDGMDEMVPWCSVPLPPRKPMVPRNTPQVGKLFIVTVPDAVPNEMLQNAFCRFGDLIMCGYQPGKRYGFANYASKKGARDALNKLHGVYLGGNKLKVEHSNQTKDNEDESSRKRPRQF